jgi:pimeloyl-ACP methyl ester carboxylesterase/UDP:flavonoid glycosyltransferase YjiC (YdhE family)
VTVTETGTRARLPDESGYVTARDGVRLYWEIHGGGSTTIALLPPNPISHSRIWKAQVHFLARHYRVVAYDGRGNGRAGDPEPSRGWLDAWQVDDCLAVLDATSTDRAVLAGICGDGVWPSIQLAATRPERVLGIVALAPGVPFLTPPNRWWAGAGDRVGPEAIRRDHRGFLEFFFAALFPEPHSTKHVEDAVAYGLDGSLEALLLEPAERTATTKEEVEEVCRRVRCPVLVVHGELDNCQPPERGLAVAELTGGEHVRLVGAGHLPNVRHPVVVNRLLHEFAARFDAPSARSREWTHGPRRTKRALLVSSPIGLGHAWRDVAVARELRRLVPGLEVHWLAQPPLTTLLEACGESVHPASAELAPEAAHVDAEAGEHELHAFQMLRRLDEIFCANFMVFHDLVREEPFDVWVADEAWELDYFLHENPELKTAPYVWLTDFVGMLPMPAGGEQEAFLAADWNAQMVEHLARHPRVRDRSLFIGEPADIVDAPLGPELPTIRAWTEPRFRFTGYITGFDPAEVVGDRARLRAELGWGADEKVCVVASGGSAAGVHLLRRAVEALPLAKEQVPELRMVVVAGPRIDPDVLPHVDGLERAGYVHELYRQLAACDVAIAHGGLSTTMELTACARPFLYFPLRGHFEQNHHVAHRLARHRAGRRLDFAADGPGEVAAALVQALADEPRYRPVTRDGAIRAARSIAELLQPV